MTVGLQQLYIGQTNANTRQTGNVRRYSNHIDVVSFNGKETENKQKERDNKNKNK